MQSKEQISSMLYATLAELQGNKELMYDYYKMVGELENTHFKEMRNMIMFARLRGQLNLLYNILGDNDIPEEYWEQIEEFI